MTPEKPAQDGVWNRPEISVQDASFITAPTESSFDYSTLPADIGSEAQATAARIKEHFRGAIIDVGSELLQIRERLPHGDFGKWLKAEFAWSERSARNYMAAAALAAKSATVADLRPGLLYQLAAPGTPEVAREEVIGQLTAGRPVSDIDIKQIINDAKSRQAEEKRNAEEAARDGKLSPRTRESREAQQAEWKRQHEKQMAHAAHRAAAMEVADMIVAHLLPAERKRLAQFVSFSECAGNYHLVDALREVTKDRPEPQAPVIEADTGRVQRPRSARKPAGTYARTGRCAGAQRARCGVAETGWRQDRLEGPQAAGAMQLQGWIGLWAHHLRRDRLLPGYPGGGAAMTGASFRSGAFQTAFARIEIPQQAGRIIRDTLEWMRVPAHVARLAGAARLAGQQLDLLIPIWPAAVIVCVIANKQRVVTGFLPDRPSLADEVVALASDMRSVITRRADHAIGEVAARGAAITLLEHGTPPSPTPTPDLQAVNNTLGALFAWMTDTAIRDQLAVAQALARPATVALIGHGTPHSVTSVWSLTVAL